MTKSSVQSTPTWSSVFRQCRAKFLRLAERCGIDFGGPAGDIEDVVRVRVREGRLGDRFAIDSAHGNDRNFGSKSMNRS